MADEIIDGKKTLIRIANGEQFELPRGHTLALSVTLDSHGEGMGQYRAGLQLQGETVIVNVYGLEVGLSVGPGDERIKQSGYPFPV